MDYHVSFLETENGNEHTWFWRDEDDGGSDLICYLCPLFRRSVCFCFCFFVLLFLSLYSAFLYVSFCVISSPSSSLPYAFSLFSLSVFSLLHSPSLPFFLSFLFPLLFFVFLFPVPALFFFPHPVFSFFLQLSPPPSSVLSLAFISRGRKRYIRNIVTTSVHHGGEEYQPRDMPPLDCSSTVFAANASPVFIASHLFEEDNE